MTAVETVTTLSQFTLGEVSGLLVGLAASRHADVGKSAVELGHQVRALAAEVDALIWRADEALTARPVAHACEPTFQLIGPGDGQPTGFRCDGCAQEWHVRPGQAAAKLIPVLREHAAQVTRG